MADTGKISVTLAPEAMAVINGAVASGEYASPSDVIADALLDWQANRSQRELSVEDLRHLWKEGLASGAGRLSSIEEIKAEVRRRAHRDNRG